jgi:ElaB/YqjD/DUF883 family membrane-anchored ribosome-binding protein
MTIGTEATTGSQHDEPTMVDQVKETTGQATEKAADTVRSQVDARTRQAADQVLAITDALRRTGPQLRTEGRKAPAGAVEKVAERGDRLGHALQEMDARQMLDQVERFARRRPWMITGAAFVGGLAASRVLKASSRDRYEPYRGRTAMGTSAGSRTGWVAGMPPAGPSRAGTAEAFPPTGSVPASSIAGPAL